MRDGASIGAATVVNQTGEAMPDKYQSYTRSMMRATAEYHGKDTIISAGGDTILKWKRDPKIAEAMVDERVCVPNLVDSGKVLTLTTSEAVKWGFCDGVARSPEEVAKNLLGYDDFQIKQYSPTFLDDLKGFLMSPVLQSILILIMIGGLYFELQSPGIGFPLAASICAAVLYFAPLYVDGLAANWEILIFLCGLVLLALEMFVIPGFGVAGIAGIVCVVGGLITGMIDNDDLDFGQVTASSFNTAFLTVVAGIVGGVVLCVWLSSRIGEIGPLNKVALHANLKDAIGVPDYSSLIGSVAISATELRPSGKITIEGDLYDAQSVMGFVREGETVKVVKVENGRLYVESLS
jgi:membrane-bound serine protease (ClpP class)